MQIDRYFIWMKPRLTSVRRSLKHALLKRLGLKGPSGKDGRLIILHLGSKDGFLPGCELIFGSKGILDDYHGDMNHEKLPLCGSGSSLLESDKQNQEKVRYIKGL